MIVALYCGSVGFLLLVIAALLLTDRRGSDRLEAEVYRLKAERLILRAALAKVSDRVLAELDAALDDDPVLSDLARRLDRP